LRNRLTPRGSPLDIPSLGRNSSSPRLQSEASFAIVRGPMANRAIWSMRKRHEWLSTPLKKKRVKRATRIRCGLQDAMDRKGTEKTEG